MPMKNIKKTKRFLVPILTLVITSVISITSIITYLNINTFKQHIKEDINNHKKEYLQKNKDTIYKKVHLVNNSIKFQLSKIENKLKKELKERIETSLNIAQYIYDKQKGKIPNEEIKQRIANHLNAIRFNEGRGYYYTFDYNTNIILGHSMSKFIGRNMTNFKDTRGLNLVNSQKKSIKNNKIGFSKLYFNKPNDPNNEYPKIVCVSKFEPLDLVIGTGEYLDVIEKQIKKYVVSRFANIKKDANYLFFLDLHNINGGNSFATMLLNPNRADLIGKKINDSYKDAKGKEFRKEFLQGLRDKGEVYTKYWYKKPNTKKPTPKMSYFYLQKDWNWIIASGFYFDDLEQKIIQMENEFQKYKNDIVIYSLLWTIIISMLVLIVAIYVSLKIDKTIQEYIIKEYKKNEELKQKTKLLMEQDKLASMGEMIGNIAHQWRQPLSVISTGATGMLVQKEFDLLTDKQFKEYCEAINKNAQYLSETIDDFKNFIQGDRVLKTFQLKDNINSFLHLVDGSIKSHHINIILDLDSSLTITAYPNELIQCYINIFNNAKDILIENNIKTKLIFISTSHDENHIIISIKDNAGGIPAKILSRIFEPYFTTKHQSQGTGLGLHMSHKLLVKGLKGNLEAINRTYKYDGIQYTGAEFILTIPKKIS